MTPIIKLNGTYLTHSSGYATQSTKQRYLSQANHPIGGVRASPLSRPDTAVKILRAKTQVLHIFFTVLQQTQLTINGLHKTWCPLSISLTIPLPQICFLHWDVCPTSSFTSVYFTLFSTAHTYLSYCTVFLCGFE
jgi:hypothetical protein